MTDPTTTPPDDLATLRETEAKMTPGPWYRQIEGNSSVDHMADLLRLRLMASGVDGVPPSTDATYVLTEDGSASVAFIGNGPNQVENGDGIVALRNAAPRLFERLAAAEEALAEIAGLSEDPDDWQPYGVLYGYNAYTLGGREVGVDESNGGDVHAHGLQQGLWLAAKVARAALRAAPKDAKEESDVARR